MIGKAFEIQKIKTTEFGVHTRDKCFYTVPVDAGVQRVLRDAVASSVSGIDKIKGDWESYSVSEEYAGQKKLASPLSDELMMPLRSIFAMKGVEDKLGVLRDVREVDFYFAVFWDYMGRKLVGLKQATRFKSAVAERGRIARLTDSTLKFVEESVFRIDSDFDLVLDK